MYKYKSVVIVYNDGTIDRFVDALLIDTDDFLQIDDTRIFKSGIRKVIFER